MMGIVSEKAVLLITALRLLLSHSSLMPDATYYSNTKRKTTREKLLLMLVNGFCSHKQVPPLPDVNLMSCDDDNVYASASMFTVIFSTNVTTFLWSEAYQCYF